MTATTQIGPAWIGRTVAALMLRLFTRRGCQNHHAAGSLDARVHDYLYEY